MRQNYSQSSRGGKMATVPLISEEQAKDKVRDIFNDIKRTFDVPFVPNLFWAMANHLAYLSPRSPGLHFAVLLMLCTSAGAQQAIMGRVVEKEMGSPIRSEVRVTLEGSLLQIPLNAVTDESGDFSFQRLSPGDYTLIASAEGYYSEKVTLTLKPREIQRIIFELTRIQQIYEEITIDAGPELLDATQTSSSTLIENAFVKSLPLARRSHLPEVITAIVPGAILGHDNLVHVRGNEMSLNTFINGVSFFDNTNVIFNAGLDADVIQSINVITGGFPAEFGNRFGGVLDIVTKSGFDRRHHASLTLGGGTHLRHNIAWDYGGHRNKLGYYFSSSGLESNRFLNPPEREAFHDTGKGMRSFAQLDYRVNANNFIRLMLSGSGMNFELPNTREEELRGRNFFERNREQTAILTWERIGSKDALLSTSIYERLTSSRLVPTTDPESIFAGGLRAILTFGIKSDYTRRVGKGHLIKLGADAVLLSLREDFAFDSRDHEIELHPFRFRGRNNGGQVSFYVQDKFEVFRNFTADLGLRYDQYSLVTSDFKFSPRINLAYSIPKTQSVIHFAYNRFFAPPPIEHVLLSGFLGETGQPVRPLRSSHYEVGLSQLIQEKLLIAVTTYWRDDVNAFETTEIANVRTFVPTNFARGRSYGAELSVKLPEIRRLGLSGYFNYAAARSFFFGPVVGGLSVEKLEPGERTLPAFDQIHTGTTGLSWRNHRTGLWASFGLEFGSGTPTALRQEGADEEVLVRLPEHLVANFSTGIDLMRKDRRKVSLQFNVENLTNRIFAIAKESEFTPVQFSAPRYVSGSITFQF